MIQEDVNIVSNINIAPGYFKMSLECDPAFSSATPGQFITLHSRKQLNPLLRRPFSIHRLRKTDQGTQGIEILYKVVGKYTEGLACMKPGETVSLLGPLGNGFRIKDGMNRIYLAAGGIGVAPIVFLADFLIRKQIKMSSLKMFLGGRSQHDLLCQNDFRDMGIKTDLATDDGSIGKKGMVTRLLEDAVSEDLPDLICACGPMPMLKAVADITEKHGIDCQISIETIMACGMGACLGCAVQMKQNPDTYDHVCIDGPVFDVNRLDF